MNFFGRAAQSLLGGGGGDTSLITLSPTASTLTPSSSSGYSSDIASSPDGRRSNTRSPTIHQHHNSDTDEDNTDTEDDSGIADAHNLTARAKRFFPDLGIGDVAMMAVGTGGSSADSGAANGATTLNTFLTYW